MLKMLDMNINTKARWRVAIRNSRFFFKDKKRICGLISRRMSDIRLKRSNLEFNKGGFCDLEWWDRDGRASFELPPSNTI